MGRQGQRLEGVGGPRLEWGGHPEEVVLRLLGSLYPAGQEGGLESWRVPSLLSRCSRPEGGPPRLIDYPQSEPSSSW